MTARVVVPTTLPAFRAAVAGLPRSAEAVAAPNGAVVVVDGRGTWWEAAEQAVDHGAGAVLVADPSRAPLEEIDAMTARAGAPVLVHRSRLRHDLVTRALDARQGVTPRVVVAECRAEPADLLELARDAVGWIRLLLGGPLEIAAAGGAALLRTPGRAHPVGTLLPTVTTAGGPVLRVRALGETTTELEIDDPLGRRELSTITASGRTIAPTLYESAARAALRRAIDILAAGGAVGDLTDLAQDVRLAADVMPASARDL
ncbi:hypothetical protein [Agromyces sp. ZXT2-6]|uniref:hypothetical protein n=1 Tax=Agromyces sp. ZXT2-6 TaxID=3461153 RepID=UPI004054D2A9